MTENIQIFSGLDDYRTGELLKFYLKNKIIPDGYRIYLISSEYCNGYVDYSSSPGLNFAFLKSKEEAFIVVYSPFRREVFQRINRKLFKELMSRRNVAFLETELFGWIGRQKMEEVFHYRMKIETKRRKRYSAVL